MKKTRLILLFILVLNTRITFGQEHNHEHAPGHCEWCDRNRDRGEVEPVKPPSLVNTIDMPVESNSMSLILLLVGLASVGLGITARSYTKRQEAVK